MTILIAALALAGCTRDVDRRPQLPHGGQPPGPQDAPRDAGPPDAATPDAATPAHALDVLGRCLTRASRARAVMQARPGHDIEGVFFFFEVDDGVLMTGAIRGLRPGERGIHIHEYGTCTPPDFESAGEHFDPTDEPHDAPFSNTKHLGDLGNVITNEKGEAIFGMIITGATLDRGPMSVLNRAVVVHAEHDDYETQPAGDAGDRLACGVIVASGAREAAPRQTP